MWNLWLDLDNTLICAMPGYYSGHAPDVELRPSEWRPDFEEVFQIYKRPGLDDFLATFAAHPHVDLHVWTAGSRAYAHAILGAVGALEHLTHVLGREDCTMREDDICKDLRALTAYGSPLDSIIFVDDHPERLRSHHGSWVIPIGSYTGDPTDARLSYLTDALLRRVDDGDIPELHPISQAIDPHWYDARGWTWRYAPLGRP